MFIIECFVTNSSLNVNQLYSYYYDEDIEKYKRVNVNFAFSNTSAIVINTIEIQSLQEKEKELGFKLSKIIEVIDDEPIINDFQFSLAKWLSLTTISPFISCLNVMLPKALRTSKIIKSPRLLEYIKKNDVNYKFTTKQKEIFDKLDDDTLLSDARKLSVSIINKFIEKGVLSIYQKEKVYTNKEIINQTAFKTLTASQNKVYESILNTEKLVSLLFGITGSGKTEVYLHLAKYYLSLNKQVLILVPEISLTPQMIQRVKERFNDVIFYHSELSDQERYEQYRRVKEKDVQIVVGTRSSIFLPFDDLGLVIIDEEHDNSYKQDSTPCYSAINVAKRICYLKNAKLLLASATPSLDSYTRALKGEYQLLKLEERINNQLPEINIINLNEEIKNKNSYIISKPLFEELNNTLINKKQAIILLNRRGYSPIVKCSECASTLMCQACDVPLNYHKDENVLKCHACGRIYKLVNECPKCKSHKLIYYGFGTKKVEEELNKLFKDAKIERMDRDNVTKKGAHKKILDDFASHNIDILIGTQMIAKGLDYPDVTLVGILNADSGLMHQDYNSSKLTFDLLMQASGRSGRATNKGKCLIQAFNPDHYALKAVLKQDYNYFYNIEMNYRMKLSYPPYSHILEIIVSDVNDERLNKSIGYLMDKLKDLNIKLYKPLSLNKINGLNRKRIMLLDSNMKNLIDSTWSIVNDYLKQKGLSKIKIDIDPQFLE